MTQATQAQTFRFQTFTPDSQQGFNKQKVVDFLFTHLDEFGDPKEDIGKCIDYALSSEPGKGGSVNIALDGDKITGAVIINKTGMQDYIPENILVYIAVDSSYRGKGLGKSLMSSVIENTEGSIALHVEPNNPARYLYEKLGFTNKYLEYRLHR